MTKLQQLLEALDDANRLANELGLDFQEDLSDIQDQVAVLAQEEQSFTD